MDSLNSFKGYNRTDEADDREFRRKTRKRITIIVISSIILLLAVSTAVAATLIHRRNSSSSSPSPSSAAASLKLVCNVTPHPSACISAISPLIQNMTTTLDPQTIFTLSLRAVSANILSLVSFADNLNVQNDTKLKSAINVCKDVFNDTAESVTDSINAVDVNADSSIDNVRTWLTTALTDLETCVDALDEQNSTSTKIIDKVKSAINNADALTSNSLAIVARILALLSKYDAPPNRRRLLMEPRGHDLSYPAWVGTRQRRLLKQRSPAPHFVVALDGSGNFLSVQAAVNAVEDKKNTTTVIYVKKGIYLETVRIEKHKWNVMIYGDGMNATILSGHLNFIDGVPTYDTATVAVNGKGFIAKDMSFINTAGPAKHQAVALRCSSDLSIFYRCSFIGFQDTLYTQSNRQLIRNCDIVGTIDFIFGNAAVIFQKCNIMVRQPMLNQFNTVTAQGKRNVDMSSAIVIDSCTFKTFDKVSARSYLGRPWKAFSTCLIMRSVIGGFVDPKGWTAWQNGFSPPQTIKYREWKNSGPGADVSKRVKWTGYRPSMTVEEVEAFSVPSFLQGKQWLPADIPSNV